MEAFPVSLNFAAVIRGNIFGSDFGSPKDVNSVLFAESLESFLYSTWHIPKSQNHKFQFLYLIHMSTLHLDYTREQHCLT
jgi:hypothetical protein